MDPLAPLISAMHGEGRLRVWSLVITAFGDLVQHRGGAISTARLAAVLGRIGVESGALRTALSRLSRDGWVERRRDGRTSIYRLSAQGFAQFAPATARIYAAPRTAPVTRWALAIRLSANGQTEAALAPADQKVEVADALVTGTLEQLSGAYRATLLDSGHREVLAALADDLGALQTIPGDPLTAAAARLLLIHRWRRIILRYRELPPELMPDNSPLPDPRAAVAALYARLSPGAEAWLETDFPGLGPMPPVDRALPARFAPNARA
jgi:phenylacetic acid degradation operon negative regulatory protein